MPEQIGVEAIFEMRDYLRAIAEYQSKLDAATRKTQTATQRMGDQYVALGGGVAKAMGGIGVAVGAAVTAVGAATVALGVDAIKTANSFESAFAGVVKTTDGLTSEFGVLNEAGRLLKEQFKELAETTPVEAEELMRIGELGGQLGVVADQLVPFTRVIADIGTATDLTTEEAAVGFSQFMNVMGTAQSDVDRLGSAIVDLGNNFATNEPQILAFAQRIAGAGRIAGLSEGQVLGIGAAMASVGVEAEAGGTAVQKVLLAMNTAVVKGGEELALFAKATGMSAEEFREAWEQDAGAVFEAFVTGLGEQGDEAILTLGKLKLEDQRLTRAFLALANAGDLLGQTMDRGEEAWSENTALANEAAQRYATTESKMAMLRNQWRNVKDDLGTALNPALNDMISLVSNLAEKYGPKLVELFETRVAPAISSVVEAFGQLVGGDVGGALETLFGEDTAARILEVAEAVKGFVGQVATFVGEHSEAFKASLIAIGAILAGAAIAAGIAAIGGALSGIGPIILGVVAAVGVLTEAWTSDWGGIRTFLTDLWTNTLQPAFASMSAWLGEKIPAAMQAVSGFWSGTLQPALAALAAYVGETVTIAIGVLVGWWEEKLLPALQRVSQFIRDEVQPVLEALGGVYIALVSKALEALSGLWQNVIAPMFADLGSAVKEGGAAFEWFGDIVAWLERQFQAVWQYVNEKILPIYRDLWEMIKGPLGEAVQWFADTVLGNLRSGFEAVGRAVDSVVGWLNRMKEKINSIQLPSWLTPGSPTPFELGLRGIGEAMRELTTIELPRLEASLQIDTTRAAAMTQRPALTPGLSGGGVISNYNLTINSSAPIENIVSDFRMMEAFA